MATKKITDLVELISAASGDVLPIVDISDDITKKIQVSNFPISTAAQTAIDAKQDTLVSGTNIKTLNSESLLGSGNIEITASPAGVAGAIQFSDGSAFASDAANLFWDDTNNRLGIGTNTPSSDLHILGKTNTNVRSLQVQNLQNQGILSTTNDGFVQIGDFSAQGYNASLTFIRPAGASRSTTFNQSNSNLTITNVNGNVTFNNTPVTIKGSGSTSATTALLVQNSAGTEAFKVNDAGDFGKLNPTLLGIFNIAGQSGNTSAAIFQNGNANFSGFRVQKNGQTLIDEGGVNAFVTSSAILELKATTKGFLPPRMTTTQKNAIATPASGLMVYDTDTNKLCCYNGTSWNNLF
jgi:hypothetical protein